MCGIKYVYQQEQREMDYHLVRAMQIYRGIVVGETGGDLTPAEVVKEVGELFDDTNEEFVQKVDRQFNGVCIECGKTLNDSIPAGERMGLCDECHSSG